MMGVSAREALSSALVPHEINNKVTKLRDDPSLSLREHRSCVGLGLSA